MMQLSVLSMPSSYYIMPRIYLVATGAGHTTQRCQLITCVLCSPPTSRLLCNTVAHRAPVLTDLFGGYWGRPHDTALSVNYIYLVATGAGHTTRRCQLITFVLCSPPTSRLLCNTVAHRAPVLTDLFGATRAGHTTRRCQLITFVSCSPPTSRLLCNTVAHRAPVLTDLFGGHRAGHTTRRCQLITFVLCSPPTSRLLCNTVAHRAPVLTDLFGGHRGRPHDTALSVNYIYLVATGAGHTTRRCQLITFVLCSHPTSRLLCNTVAHRAPVLTDLFGATGAGHDTALSVNYVCVVLTSTSRLLCNSRTQSACTNRFIWGHRGRPHDTALSVNYVCVVLTSNLTAAV
ncbi:hypothetical protein J6590_067581 [Homalodisca vitripennis]|nr:hypothetical protein J6590_067581 [Homalodisca vitripennis]